MREEHDVTGKSIVRALSFPRRQISALENGHLGRMSLSSAESVITSR
ncbi:hypothetical protein [Micromonospora chalcea]